MITKIKVSLPSIQSVPTLASNEIVRVYTYRGDESCLFKYNYPKENTRFLDNGEYIVIGLKKNTAKNASLLGNDVIADVGSSKMLDYKKIGVSDGGIAGFIGSTCLARWSRGISVETYNALYKVEKDKTSNLTILCIVRQNGKLHFYTCDSIINLRRYHWGCEVYDEDTTEKKTFTIYQSVDKNLTEDQKKLNGTNGEYSNGFFLEAGFYYSNRLANEFNYIVYNENGQVFLSSQISDNKSLTDAEVLTYYNEGSGDKIAKLRTEDLKELNVQHYTDVTLEEIRTNFQLNNNGGGSTSSAAPSIDLDIDANYVGSLNFIKDYNLFNLLFVPCKDKRKGIKDLSDNNIQIKIIPYGGATQKTSKSNVTYYESSVPALYATVTSVPANATKSDKAETLLKNSVQPMSSSDLFLNLDKLLYYPNKNGNYLWSKDGNMLPGLVQVKGSNMEEKIAEIKKYQKYYSTRMIKSGYLILKKSYELPESYDKDSILKAIKSSSFITFSQYMGFTIEEKKQYKIYYYQLSLNTEAESPETVEDLVSISTSDTTSFSVLINSLSSSLQYNFGYDYTVDCNIIQERGSLNLYDFKLFEAYTRGHDFIQDDYTIVRAKERDPNNKKDNSRLMDFDDNYFTYKYTGRDFDIFFAGENLVENDGAYFALVHEKDLLQEEDVTLGDAYSCQKYFIQAIKYPKLNDDGSKTQNYLYKDTFKVTDFVEAIDNTKYVEEDLEIKTAEIDLLQCEYYNPNAAKVSNGWCDCCYGNKGTYNKECLYQKMGICPYRFNSEKHPRRIRTLQQSKSNRFNLIQELSKVFEFYPYFYIEFDDNGRIKLDENGKMKKHVFFMTEKGSVNYNGFRYEKNLSSISRNVDSSSFTTKMYVENVDSDLSDTGICSIQTATDNISRNPYLLDFSYYTKRGLLDPEQTQRDIYGIEKGDLAFLPTIGSYNKKYDQLSNLINTLTGEEMTTLLAGITVAVTGITTALEERKKVSQTMYQFKVRQFKTETKVTTLSQSAVIKETYTTSDSYKSYLQKFREQAVILWGLVEQLFFSNNYFTLYLNENESIVVNLDNPNSANNEVLSSLIIQYKDTYCKGELFWRLTLEGFENNSYKPPFKSWDDFKLKIVDKYLYPTNGQLGQYKGLLEQVKYWKTERQKILNKINDISDKFYKVYEPYIKEGTWTDSNYLTDNEYYWASVSVLNDSCKPKTDYTINVVDISPIEVYSEDYEFDLYDTTYVVDIDFFGINPKTGLPNKEKVLISEVAEDLDELKPNQLKIQNYTTQFDDLFESITASVQSLTFNENTYRRASNFTSQQYIEQDSLQGTLNQGNLTLIDANNNILLDDSGTQGNGISNSSSQYNLTGEGLYFSTDGGTTWDVGVSPQGINADYIKFGQIDASKIQIVDGEYIYFLWDKNGINAYRNPATSTNGLVDFARFNKYGLSLVENNHVRLRAGYEYKSSNSGVNPTGDYDKELPLSNQNVGFYLYNDTGKPIFKTETRSEYSTQKDTDYSARLSLKGEIFATNRNLDSDVSSISNGGISSATFGKKLRVGYSTKDVSVPVLYSSLRAKFVLQNSATQSGGNWTPGSWVFVCDEEGNQSIAQDKQGGSSIKLTPVVVSENSSGTTKYYYSYSVTVMRNLSKLKENVETSNYYLIGTTLHKQNDKVKYTEYSVETRRLTLKTEATDYNPSSPGTLPEKTFEITNLNLDPFNSEITINGNKYTGELNQIYNYLDRYTTLNSTSYRLQTKTIRLVDDIENSANIIIGPRDLTPENITYYNVSRSSTTYTPSTATLYKYEDYYRDQAFQYWLKYEDTTEIVGNSSSVSTDQIGIFINNKISLDEDDTESDSNFETGEEESVDLNNPFNTSTFCVIGDTQAEILQANPDANSYASHYIGVKNMKIGEDIALPESVISRLKGMDKVAIWIGIDGKSYQTYENDKDKLKTAMDKTINSIKKYAAGATIYLFTPLNLKDDEYQELDKYSENLKQAYSGSDVTVIDVFTETDSYINGSINDFDIAKVSDVIYNLFSDEDHKITPGSSRDKARELNQKGLLEGFERMFVIAAQSKDQITNNKIYRNILSVLKNGSLYMGGEIQGEYGQVLDLNNIGYLPDKIRISNPNLILTGDGRIFCDWNKFYQIKNGQLQESGNSLEDILTILASGISSGGTSGGGSSGSGGDTPSGGGGTTVSGYYLIDPIA